MSRGTVGRPMEILMVEDDLEDAGLTIEALRRRSALPDQPGLRRR